MRFVRDQLVLLVLIAALIVGGGAVIDGLISRLH